MLLNIGQRFGKLTVQGILGRDSHYHYSVSVKCDCGNNKVVKHTNLNNGIDREDNTIGYTVLNSLPCCSVCNFMKMKLGKEMFVSQCRRIVNNLNKEVS